VLVVGRDEAEIDVLSAIALVHVGGGSEVVALELDTTSIDEQLAWYAAAEVIVIASCSATQPMTSLSTPIGPC
jgi:hypothetical protein